ncbi:hypothetical protein FRC07_011510 [Ceratobasidium sp. 392]|nr:hypothetical protein FRC07_011510 [Ceratobasidium sp. 392]
MAFPPLSLTHTRSRDSHGPSTPQSSYIASLPDSPVSPLAPRSPSPSRPGLPSRQPSQLRPRDARPAYLPFRRISLPPGTSHKRDSVASVLSIDSVQEREEQQQQNGSGLAISSSLPTESSMPHMDIIDDGTPLAPPPPLPISGSSSHSSPSRRPVLLPSASSPATPTRFRPRPTPPHHLAKTPNQVNTRPALGGGKHSRRMGSKTQIVERNKEREEKRRKVLKELLDTEQSYVDGLDLVYNHFLAPLIDSLTSPNPLLTPADLGVIFPGFIDILNFNRSFLSDLRSVLVPTTSALPIPGANPSSTSLVAGQSLPNEAGGILLRPAGELSTSASSSSAHPFLGSNSVYSQGYVPSNPDLSSSAIILEDEEPPGVPNVAPLLAQHFPYLKLYKPFVTAFPASMERLAKLSGTFAFEFFVLDKERDPVSRMLGLRSWLLTVVQRCPRYLMLVGDILKYTGEEEEGYGQLVEAHALLSNITGQLNTSLADHTAVLALLDLQRNTSNLPAGFSFVAPGRSLVRRGRLRMSGQEDMMRRGWIDEPSGDREVLLFSDCVVWLEREREWGVSGVGVGVVGVVGVGMRHSAVGVGLGRPSEMPKRPTFGRTRSKSEAELPTLKSTGSSPETPRTASGFVKGQDGRRLGGVDGKARQESRPSGDGKPLSPIGETGPRRPGMIDHHASSSSSEERWRFRGMAGLMDVDVVISPRNAMQIDFLSPEGSFALYASSNDEREEWIGALRSTKATLLAAFNVMHPDSTLTSSSSTTHLRRVLQALPYPPGEATIRGARAQSSGRKSILRNRRQQAPVVEESEDQEMSSLVGETKRKERRGRVEHFVPAIWVPDKESAVCMRCGSAFGWRRRRHHCRLCGRVVCAACSQKSFFVMDPANASASKSHKPERACSLCYEAVFPVIHSSDESLHTGPDRGGTIMPLRNSPARPRVLQHLMTSPVTTPIVERGNIGVLGTPISNTTLLTSSSAGPTGTSPSGNSASSQSAVGIPSSRSNGTDLATSTTAQTITSLDSQRTVQPGAASELSSITSGSQPSSRPRSLDVGRRIAAASAFVYTAGVTARTKVSGRGKGRRMSLVSGRRNTGGSRENVDASTATATLGRGAAAQQLSELLGRSPK